ncbi:hypothetical protein JCM19294_717 [Nonlabens tegetincola]|uniref:Uncharacterized protein n=1 Tax=Nonlabens tegetincola TaxID=323273 RepID=A0A090Q4S6_9FLAO|nr:MULTISPECIES: head GIN domain-containing protein [Nonlabens]ALM19944.1 hypothetical protein AAT17_01060 [Nonlabens sp. MIC269]PQJ16896.1 DUF2807 domain-containing protein [Nonlabens tegetincola]GAK98084.1 hypothetical protein JCM19294_717 [Nonlabens tegetincola]
MKHITLLFIALLSVQLSQAQWWGKDKIKGNGEVISKTFEVGDYDKVNVRNSIDVTLVAGKEGSIEVKAESNIMEHIEIEVKGGRLKIGIEDGYNVSTRKGIYVTVPVQEIEALSLAGSGDIHSELVLKSSNMEISVAGSGNIEVETESRNLEVNVAGSGDIILKGRTENLDASVAGSGDIEGFGLRANNIDASIAGSGDISVYCNGGTINASIAGSGDIVYDGKSSKVKTSIIGSGDVEKR